MVVNLEPQCGKVRFIAKLKLFLQQVTDVYPAVALFPRDVKIHGQLACPQVAQADGTTQSDQQDYPDATGSNDLENHEQG
jgi:hypothetical protein